MFRGEASVQNTQDLTLELWVVLSRAQAAIEAHARADLARQDLTLAEFGALEDALSGLDEEEKQEAIRLLRKPGERAAELESTSAAA
jgi:hypothetical protein